MEDEEKGDQVVILPLVRVGGPVLGLGQGLMIRLGRGPRTGMTPKKKIKGEMDISLGSLRKKKIRKRMRGLGQDPGLGPSQPVPRILPSLGLRLKDL